MDTGHPDYPELDRISQAIAARAGGIDKLRRDFPQAVRDVIDSIVDPVRTGRTQFHELDNVEKTFIGLRLEHVLRDMIDVPAGLRDLVIDGMDVDVKTTTGSTWMIPPETARDQGACVLLRANEPTLRCWLGVFFARPENLTAGGNRDGKRSVSAAGRANVLWLLDGEPYPANHWIDIDTARFRELRDIKGGTNRACQFFRENLGLKVNRAVIQALLYEQSDYMKRLRGNGGARDQLAPEGIAILSGVYDAPLAERLGYGVLASDEMLAIAPRDDAEREILLASGRIR